MPRIVVVVLSVVALLGVAAVPASAADSRATPTKVTVLKKGSRGPAVKALQKRLGIPVDGVFGRQTKAAVKRFQRRNGLVADGIAGPATLAALGLRSSALKTKLSPGEALAKIADCESGGNPRAVSPDGRYRGKYQFSRPTWRAMGGEGDPAKASEAEQDKRARMLYDREGAKPWPACARKLGLIK